jgi:transposase
MAAIRKFLTDEQWAKIAPLLPSEGPGSKGGRPRVSNREVLEGILWTAHRGVAGKTCPSNIPVPDAISEKFGTEKACQKHLFRLRWPEGFRCPRCQHDQAYFQRTRNLYHCRACGYQASLTAGTVFHKTRTPLHKWFWMIW